VQPDLSSLQPRATFEENVRALHGRKGTACFLYPTPNACTSQASQVFWSVADVDREIEALKARGVVFEDYDMPGEKSPSGAITEGDAKAAWFKDSEGNIFALIQDV
jgi:predicted enzyme related to lactoylglutathione lyase